MASPHVFFKDFVAVDLAVAHHGILDHTGAFGLAELLTKHLVFAGTFKRSHVARVQIQLFLIVIDVVVVGHAHGFFVNPLRQVLVTHAQRLQGGNRCGVGVQTVIVVFGDVLGHKAPLGVSAGGVLDRGVHVDAETVAHTANFDVLIERIWVAVFGQDADVAFTIGHLVLASGVIDHVCVRDVLDVANHAVEHLGNLDVGLVVDRDHLGTRAVLTHVVGDLVNVLWQLVDGQAGACIDRLTLHRATGGQHVSRPLPLIVGRTGVELEVVEFVFTRLGKRTNRNLHAITGCGQNVLMAVLFATTSRHIGGSYHSCWISHVPRLLKRGVRA